MSKELRRRKPSVTFTISNEINEKIDEIAAAEDRSRSEIAETALKRYFETPKPEAKFCSNCGKEIE